MSARSLLLVDLTNIVCRCSLGGPVAPEPAAGTACNMVARVAAAIGATHLVCAVDSSAPSWRRERAPLYKAGRSLNTTPYSRAAADEAARRGWLVFQADGYEADDVIKTVTERSVARFEVAIYSGDTDLEALVRSRTDLHRSVYVIWPKAGGTWELHHVSAVRARHGLSEPAQLTDFKAIAGEPGDNIEGLGGRTPKGAIADRSAVARRLLAAFGSLEGVIAAGAQNASREAREVFLVRDRLRFARELVALRADVPLPELRPSECALEQEALRAS